VELPLRASIWSTTVAELATVITDSQPKPEEFDQMAQLLAEVENFSLEEIQAQLAKESPISNNKTYGIQPAIFLRRWVNNSIR